MGKRKENTCLKISKPMVNLKNKENLVVLEAITHADHRCGSLDSDKAKYEEHMKAHCKDIGKTFVGNSLGYHITACSNNSCNYDRCCE